MATTKKAPSKKKENNAAQSGFSKETYLTWFESMLLMRKFEEKAGQLYGQQKIRGFCHLYIGQEACVAGAISALEEGDKYITAYRDHAHPLGLGSDPGAIMAELYGKATGISKGKGGSMHMFDKEKGFFGGHGIVGGQIPLGTGIAFAEMYQKTGKLCIAYMGDGAVRQGAVHEAFNLAMVYKLPCIFVIENNGYGLSTPSNEQFKFKNFIDKGPGYGIDAIKIDGNNVLEVYDTIKQTAHNLRKNPRPVLIEALTFRMRGHEEASG
ncbi:MAG: pyruvate dehydrogenase (acetyl-transferring) E1 component subunit alpha, partial [Bacteroidetes bacterium]|nr:pyruvate dehydrogenase (acetyl-transferring) E1 component subunit alpha [Bacteroidota bacterium]